MPRRMTVTIGFIHNIHDTVKFEEMFRTLNHLFEMEVCQKYFKDNKDYKKYAPCEFKYIFSQNPTELAEADLVYGLSQAPKSRECTRTAPTECERLKTDADEWRAQLTRLSDTFSVNRRGEPVDAHASSARFILKEDTRTPGQFVPDVDRNASHAIIARMKRQITHAIERKIVEFRMEEAKEATGREEATAYVELQESVGRSNLGFEEVVKRKQLETTLSTLKDEFKQRMQVEAEELRKRKAAEDALKKKEEAHHAAKQMMSDLLAYAGSTPSEFWIAKSSRSINAVLNRKLASELHRQLSEAKTSEEMQQIISKAQVNYTRLGLIAGSEVPLRMNPDFVERPINSKRLNAILEAGRKYFPEPTLENMDTKIASIILDLENYTKRVKETPAYGFSIFVASRKENRVVNCRLAERIQNELSQAKTPEEVAKIFTKERIAALRKDGFSRTDFKDSGINSAELNKAIDRARSLFPVVAQPSVRQAEEVASMAI